MEYAKLKKMMQMSQFANVNNSTSIKHQQICFKKICTTFGVFIFKLKIKVKELSCFFSSFSG